MPDIDIGQISEALNDKMDLDSGNANPAVAKQSDLAILQNTVSQLQATVTSLQGEISKVLGRIDYSQGVSTTLGGNNSYTCPSDGYIFVSRIVNVASVSDSIDINGTVVSYLREGNNPPIYPVSQGDVVTATKKSSGTLTVNITFCPQKS